jgi:hypothetical protein
MRDDTVGHDNAQDLGLSDFEGKQFRVERHADPVAARVAQGGGAIDRMISSIDPSSVALVGVMALAERVHAQEREIAAQGLQIEFEKARLERSALRFACGRTRWKRGSAENGW